MEDVDGGVKEVDGGDGGDGAKETKEGEREGGVEEGGEEGKERGEVEEEEGEGGKENTLWSVAPRDGWDLDVQWISLISKPQDDWHCTSGRPLVFTSVPSSLPPHASNNPSSSPPPRRLVTTFLDFFASISTGCCSQITPLSTRSYMETLDILSKGSTEEGVGAFPSSATSLLPRKQKASPRKSLPVAMARDLFSETKDRCGVDIGGGRDRSSSFGMLWSILDVKIRKFLRNVLVEGLHLGMNVEWSIGEEEEVEEVVEGGEREGKEKAVVVALRQGHRVGLVITVGSRGIWQGTATKAEVWRWRGQGTALGQGCFWPVRKRGGR